MLGMLVCLAGPVSFCRAVAARSAAGSPPDESVVIAAIRSCFAAGGMEPDADVRAGFTGYGPAADGRLARIISDCREIAARRTRFRRHNFFHQIDGLEQFRGLDSRRIDASAIIRIMSEAAEYAGEKERTVMFEDELAVRAIEAALKSAADLEAQGSYYQAYTGFIKPLNDIYGDDTYRKWARRLLQKAEIAALLQGIPCDGVDPFSGAKRRILEAAMKTLDSAYVAIVDYADMAAGALDRCGMLCDVLRSPEIVASDPQDWERLEGFAVGLEDMVRYLEQLPEMDRRNLMDVLDQVLELNGLCRGGCIDEDLLIAQFAAGAMSRLDPYTTIYWPNQVKELRRVVTNEFGGVGIQLSASEGWVEIVEVLPDSPACEVGLMAGDLITAVDGIYLEGLTGSCAAGMISGPAGTDVSLAILRKGWDREEQIVLERAFIRMASVFGWRRDEKGRWLHMIDPADNIGYIRISGFDSRTFAEFRQAVDGLLLVGLDALILDLRGNLGGVLDCAVRIADTFIDEGLLLRTQPRYGMPTYISATKEDTLLGFPVLVLIDRHTASSAEIVAGVLSDPKYGSAVLVGEKSYGKGSVQAITTTIGGGARLKYTAAFYHMPSGQRVVSRYEVRDEANPEWGMRPQIEMELTEAEFERVRRWWRAADTAGSACSPEYSDTVQTIQDILDADPQLAIALLAAKGMINEQLLAAQ